MNPVGRHALFPVRATKKPPEGGWWMALESGRKWARSPSNVNRAKGKTFSEDLHVYRLRKFFDPVAGPDRGARCRKVIRPLVKS